MTWLDKRVFTTGYNGEIRAVDDNGSTFQEAWTLTGVSTGDVNDVAIDRSGDCYYVDGNSKLIRKYIQTENGVTPSWTYTFTEASYMRCVAVDFQKNVYSANFGFGTGYVVKIKEDADGLPQREWLFTASRAFVDIAVDDKGYVAAGTTNGRIYFISPDGIQQWMFQANAGSWIRDIHFDVDGNIYALQGFNKAFIKINRSGDEVWRYTDLNYNMLGSSITKDGHIYLVGQLKDEETGDLICLIEDSEGQPELKWKLDIPDKALIDDPLHQVAARPDNSEIYVCGYRSINSVYKIVEVDGVPSIVWEYDGTTENVREVRCVPEFTGTFPEAYGLRGKASVISQFGVVQLSEGVRKIY